jgi:C4-type Zn-finger protein
MAKYLQRSCPKCNGYLGIVVPEGKPKMPVQAINGRCLKCGYRLAWVLVLGKRFTRRSERRYYARN